MADIQLHRLISRYSTNPNQPPIPNNDTLNIVENVTTPLDVVANDNCLIGRQRDLVSVNSTVNCTAVKSGNIVNVTGTSAGVGSFNYIVSDGSTTASGSVTLSITSGLSSVVVTDATHTDFGSEVSTGNTIFYSALSVHGAIVSIDALGQVSVAETYVVGDTFVYRVGAGTLQTFTFL